MKKQTFTAVLSLLIVLASCTGEVMEAFVLTNFSNQWKVVKGHNNVGKFVFFLTFNVDSVKFSGDLEASEQGNGENFQLVGNFVRENVTLKYLEDDEANNFFNGENAGKTYKGKFDRSKPAPYYLRLLNVADRTDSLVIVQNF